MNRRRLGDETDGLAALPARFYFEMKLLMF